MSAPTELDQEVMRRMKAALAEAGYPDAHVFWHVDLAEIHVTIDDIHHPEWRCPSDVIERAFKVCDPRSPSDKPKVIEYAGEPWL